MRDGRKTVRLTAAQAIVRYLAVQYSARDGAARRLIPGMFGIFGHGNVQGLGQALAEYPDLLPVLPARSEQAMVHIAAAYARSERRLATYACTASIGPGATNMVTGAALATVNRLPVLLLPADYFAGRQQGPVLQQLENFTSGDMSVNEVFRTVCRYFDRITRPEQLLTALPEACRVLTSPRETGAVALALPQDVQCEAYDYPEQFFDPHEWHICRVTPTSEQVAQILRLIERSQRPVAIAGGGVRYSQAEGELAQFARQFNIPVAETFAGKGVMGDETWLTLGGMGTSGNPAANALLRDADLVICLGTRMTDTQTGSQTLFQSPAVRFIAVNVDEHDAMKQGALPVVADIRETLRALCSAATTLGCKVPRIQYKASIEAVQHAWSEQLQGTLDRAGPLSQAQVVGTLNESVSPGDVVVGAAGTLPTDLLKSWRAVGDRDCYLEFGFSCMTHEIPAGIGLRLSREGGEVYVLLGDGSFLMNPSELATAVQCGLKLTVIVVENRRYQSIYGIQLRRCGPSSLGNEFKLLDAKTGRQIDRELPLDLAKIAEGFGTRATTVSSKEELENALSEARGATRTSVIVARLDADATPGLPASGAWRDIPAAEVSLSSLGAERLAEYETEREERRFFSGLSQIGE